MTEQRFFQIMTIVPVVVPIVAAVIGFGLRSLGSPSGATEELSLTIGMAGAYSAIPYLLFLVLLFGVVRPSTLRAWHRVLWWSPLIIALGFTGALFVFGMNRQQGSSSLGPAVFWGELALMTGYLYAVLIRACEMWFRHSGRL